METYRASDGAALAFDDRGPRGTVPLLFLHGWRADHRIWERVIDILSARHRTVAVDLRGAGASRSAPGPYTLEVFSNDLSDLVKTIDLDPFVTVSHSMGGALAQRFAIDNPEALEGEILVAPIPASGPHFTPAVESFLRATVGNPEKTAGWLARLTRQEQDRETRELLAAAAAASTDSVARAMLEDWLGLDFATGAATIETPTLVVVPEHDPPMTPAYMREYVTGLIPGSRLEVVAGAGHYLPLETPQELARIVEGFLEELEAQ